MALAAPSDNSKKALATLDAALKSESKQAVLQQNMDLRKDRATEQHSVAEQEAAEHSSWRPICARC
jgi:hypothetical protein